MNRRLIAMAVLAGWLASLGWLLLRSGGTEEERTTGARARRLAPEATYYTLRLGEDWVGAATLTLDTTAVGYTLQESAVLVLGSPGGPAEEHRATRHGTYGRTFRLEAIDVAGSDEPGAPAVRVEVLPTATALIRGGSRDHRASLSLPGPVTTTQQAVALHLATRRVIRPGHSDTLAVLDAGAATWDRGRVVVGTDSVALVSDSATRRATARWEAAAPESTRVWRVDWTGERGVPVRQWVTDAGRVVLREPAFGLRQEAAPYEVSYLNFRASGEPVRAGAATLTGAHWLATQQARPPVGTPVRVVLRRWDGPAWPGSVMPLGDGRQVARGDTITILPSPAGEPRPVALPTDYVGDLYPGERRLLEAKLAGALTGGGDTSDTVAALVRAASLQGAGDAAVRSFVSMAQLAGYVARPVHGIDVRSPGLPGHRWAEVWRGGWQAVDPARGHRQASTTLLRLGTGLLPGLETLVTTFGGLRLTELP